jgi:hypothetical protein
VTAAETAAVSEGCRDGCSDGFSDGAAAAAAMLAAIAQQRCATTPHGAATAQRRRSSGGGNVGSDCAATVRYDASWRSNGTATAQQWHSASNGAGMAEAMLAVTGAGIVQEGQGQ